MKWGVISGLLISCVLTMIFYNLGLSDPGNSSGTVISILLKLAISFTLVFIGIKNYKTVDNQCQLTLGRGVFWSLGYGLIASMIALIFAYLFYTYLAPDIISEAMELQLVQMEEDGLSDEDIEASLPWIEPLMTPLAWAIMGAFVSIIVAIVEGLIASLILKTR